MNIFISQIFIFVYNSLISVMYYKGYNELPGTETKNGLQTNAARERLKHSV